MMKRLSIIPLLLLLLVALFACHKQLPVESDSQDLYRFHPEGKLTISAPDSSTATNLIIEIADDSIEQTRGLMDRDSLLANQGMLFIFEDVAPRQFWMKNTYIPLDILFIDAEGFIRHIVKNAKPLDETPLPSVEPAKYVLEVMGGFSDQHKITPGYKISWKDNRK